MLNTSRQPGYKALAKRTESQDCPLSDNPLSHVFVDFRSRLFMYIRKKYINRLLSDKIRSVFRVIDDISLEMKYVFNEALQVAKADVSAINAPKTTYVFPSSASCQLKLLLLQENRNVAKARKVKLDSCIALFKAEMLNIERLRECIAAMESYIISDIDNLCALYRGSEWMLVPTAEFVVPQEEDAFESDRMCARLSKAAGRSSAVLSEDLDCAALFGAEFVIKDVFKGFFSYITLNSIKKMFDSSTRAELVKKCCIMGTDYNLGLKGVGPVRVKKIDKKDVDKLCKCCISAQSISNAQFNKFFMI